ncbi:hypothetical protein [Streptomyces sp. NPDC055692]|uniref:hypothetical protein n=1 Tax=Streptomyces sp. NPDC055692 TaxID=3155683 RepID=UPI0034289724
MAFEVADPGWVAIARDSVTGRVSVKGVRFFELDDEGTWPLVKNRDGAFFPPGPETVEVIRTDALHALKLAAMHELVGMAERATNPAQLEVVEKAAAWVMAYGEPQGA